jgi:osmoprotectant transport system permease protein
MRRARSTPAPGIVFRAPHRRAVAIRVLVLFIATIALAGIGSASTPVTVGSKAFPESWILGEALSSLMRSRGVEVTHRSNLGGTEIVDQALESGSVDVYPEYTGTILEVILKSPSRPSLEEMRAELAKKGLGISDPIGFNDGYAIALSEAAWSKYRIGTLTELAAHPEIRLGLTHEFLGRPDGYPGLSRAYGLHTKRVRGIQHELAYQALASGSIDGTDIYTTDAQIERMHLHVLLDDRGFFPRYQAVWLYRLDLARRAPQAIEAMRRLEGRVDEARMIRANARVVLGGQSFQRSADSLLVDALGESPWSAEANRSVWLSILSNTGQHLKLVLLSLIAAVLIGIPLGIFATTSRFLSGPILATSGLLQTIPSLALLAVLIPLLGIGIVPALVALFLYSLLPIVRNTYVGLTTIPSPLSEAASAIGLSPLARLLRVRLPMASPAIMAGIRTSAIIDVGTATLAALIGAGGLGEPILSGIQLRRNDLIMQGAIPAAVLALLVERGFSLIERWTIPKGLRLPPSHE